MMPLTGIDNRGAGHIAPNSLGFPARALLKPGNGHRNVLCLPASFIPYSAVLSRGRLPEVDNERIGATPPRVSVAVGYLSGGSSLEAFEIANSFFCARRLVSRNEAVKALGRHWSEQVSVRPRSKKHPTNGSRIPQLLPF
jgi:hypothetical protein